MLDDIYKKAVETYKVKTKLSAKAYEKASQYMAAGETRSVSYFAPYPITMDYGKGSKIYDIDGNVYIDFVNNYTSLLHGHAHPVITKAMIEAAGKGVCSPVAFSEQILLAKLLCERVPGVERIRFCNSGTEATMFAVRAARAYTRKDGIVKMLGGYHGTTDMFEYSVSPDKSKITSHSMYHPIPDSLGISENAGKDMYIVPFNDLPAAEAMLKSNHEKIAAVIVEPFLGAGGVIPAKEGYLQGLRELTEKYGVLLIFDEVQALRLSTGGAQKKYQVIPDLSAFGKIIGGGLAVGAFGGKEEIMDVFNRKKEGHLTQSGTFNGNRVTMAAGLAALSLYDEEAVIKLENMSEYMEGTFEKVIQETEVSACVTRAGSILNIHFQKEKPYDYLSKTDVDKKIMDLYFLELLNRGIFHATRGMWVLSTVTTKEDIDKAGTALREVLTIVKPYL